MPIYEYECPKCGLIEIMQKASEKPVKKCPECEKKGKTQKIERVISASAFHLKGGGWYKTDYSGSKGAATDTGSKPSTPAAKDDSSKTETKTEASPEKKGKDSLKTTGGGSGGCGSGCGCH